MTTPPADSNSPENIPRSPTIEAAQCEAGLRRVLAYICTRRHRRLIAFAALFLLIYSLTRILVTFVTSVPFGLFIGFIVSQDIPISLEMLGLLQSLTSLIPSLIVTSLIFMRLRRAYLSYIQPQQLAGKSETD